VARIRPGSRWSATRTVAATSGQAIPADGGAVDGTLAEDPAYEEAATAFEKGDYDAAERAYEAILAATPGEPNAAGALAGVRLFKRAEHLDPTVTRETAQAKPDDVAAQLAASDVDMLEGRIAEAFARLVDLVARTSGAERDQARLRLLELFEAAGPDEPAIAPTRAALSRALF